MCIKNNAKDDATGVLYIPWVCVWALVAPSAHFSGLYTRIVGISLLVYTHWLFLRPLKTNDAKVQIPTFFVCG